MLFFVETIVAVYSQHKPGGREVSALI